MTTRQSTPTSNVAPLSSPGSELTPNTSTIKRPLAGDTPLTQVIDALTREADLYTPLEDGAVRCNACAHRCRIKPGGRGVCQVRYNLDSKLYAPWGYVAGLQCDPIEKKPFYHVYPGAHVLTFGMLGCDLHCPYCQNWDISQALRDDRAGYTPIAMSPEQIVQQATWREAVGIASSYNEPLITSEWARAIFEQGKAAGLSGLYVSNGNATREVLEYMRPYTEAYKIDLKTMQASNYRQLGAVLDHILDGIRMVHELGFWLEIVTLIVPGFNDDPAELRDMAHFIRSLSPDIPWHVIAFHQDYRMRSHANTDAAMLRRAAQMGYEEGLNYVYAGNLPGQIEPYEDTRCPNCQTTVIKRWGFTVIENWLMPSGTCPKCQTPIPGLWQRKMHDHRDHSPTPCG